MEVRMVDENTAIQAAGLCACAFDFSSEDHLKTEEILMEERKNPRTYNDSCWKDRVVAVEDDKVIATVGCYQYQVYFDGQIVNMSAIGGVATYPEYRNKGAIRECFQKSFEYMEQNNQVLSFMYPFSSSYYRQFGYGPLCSHTEWLI
ncbi:MAG: GNAT family N-acetyltransferase, partial [Oscillospiraceae bacterium]